MNFLVKTIVFVLISYLGTLHNLAWGQEHHIEMLAGLSKPPFVMANEDRGMQLEIIEAAFAKSNRFVRFTYLPLSRHLDVFHSRGFDGIITLTEHQQAQGICLSAPYIVYQNVVVTLANSTLKINKLDDLAELNVAAFQNATKFLGEKYHAIFTNSPHYTELADQQSQVGLLFSGRVDALVMDINIFKHLLANKRRESSNRKDYNKEFVIHFLFKPRVYTAGFKNKQLCQQFDQGIKAIMDDGSYQQIIDSYLN